MRTDTRRHQRVAISLPVELRHLERSIRGTSRDLSLGGMFILCEEGVPFGAQIQLLFELPLLGQRINTEATVRWVDINTGIGVQFAGLRAGEVWALLRLMQKQGGDPNGATPEHGVPGVHDEIGNDLREVTRVNEHHGQIRGQ